MNYDVIVVGAGPIGITTACAIKAGDPDVNICVVDKRKDPTRNHGLKINADSVQYIQNVLKEMPKCENVQVLSKIFDGWSGQFIRTVKIEEDLTKEAERMGITVLRGNEHEVTESSLQHGEIFKNARIIIGADGAHSIVRKVVMGDIKADEQTLRHLVELKYQTEGTTAPRSYFEASSEAAVNGNLDFESMNKKKMENTKPVTLHIFVEEPTFRALREVDGNGNLKGVFGNSWTLAEIEEKAKTDDKISRLNKQFKTHLDGLKSRGGGCYEEKISTLVMNIYRSEKCAEYTNGKYVLLVGDSESGIVLEGGFNKGLKGAAECASHVIYFLKNSDHSTFARYQDKMITIFNKARDEAVLKDTGIKVVESSLRASHASVEMSSSSFNSANSSCVIS